MLNTFLFYFLILNCEVKLSKKVVNMSIIESIDIADDVIYCIVIHFYFLMLQFVFVSFISSKQYIFFFCLHLSVTKYCNIYFDLFSSYSKQIRTNLHQVRHTLQHIVLKNHVLDYVLTALISVRKVSEVDACKHLYISNGC